MDSSVAYFLEHGRGTAFSFEVLPPVRGKGIDALFADVRRLMQFDPAYVNITTHRSDVVYREQPGGVFTRVSERARPGTVAIAAALKGRFGVATVPHIICSGFSASEIENELIDLTYLGINDILVLRGDRAKGENRFIPAPGGHSHAVELCRQVVDYNNGHLLAGEALQTPATPFSFGVAGYPEKHEESMNPESDLLHLKEKIDAGAGYVVTQMFFDNRRYFDFVDRCRKAGITVPVVPGIKPLTSLTQMALLPKTFHIDFPEELSAELEKCSSNEQVKALGVEWGIAQARELKAAGVPSIHFYSMNAAASVESIARQVY
ncbi:MAG: methylenetetrahydrofolate reductase [Candidatus Cryptobacteroides sp.]